MFRLLKSRSKRVGLSPGSLVPIGEPPSHPIKLSIIEYTESEYIEKDNASIQECLEYIEKPNMTWIQAYGVNDPSTIASIGNHFKLHALVMEDVLNPLQRPKLDVYQDQVFIVARLLHYDEAKSQLQDEQASIIFGPNFLISFMEREADFFKPIKDRLQQRNNRIRKQGSDYLAYTLLDLIVDYYFVVLEKIDVSLDNLEEELVRSPKAGTLQHIQQAKREMIFLRKSIWPMRDVVSHFQRLEPSHVSPNTQIYLRDVYDHLIQTIDIIEGFRDVVSGMLDIYLSNINIRTNEIMKVLTIVSTIFVPLTFVCSLYGMNFDHMPELHTRWGYPIVLLVMASMAIAMLLFFHRKKWL
ncbi:magnesium/cobalt transporter CorA [Candidatus Protochlamydia phocaeensis]|uniref:magnesium/cobalt transporter CorA n=1 Tax=Candidatus Protochlamydia phocaeensis TaxID=1414722 RepID=UPI0008395D6E|nr:magnesium/cobalt transporter CorA [Candidatus Protochlamydia phocaeensis]